MNQRDNNQREKPNKPSLILRALWIIGIILLLIAAVILGYFFGRFVNEKCGLIKIGLNAIQNVFNVLMGTSRDLPPRYS